jgi:hypothetical protein
MLAEHAKQSGVLVQALGRTKTDILMTDWGYLQSEIKKIGKVLEIQSIFRIHCPKRKPLRNNSMMKPKDFTQLS